MEGLTRIREGRGWSQQKLADESGVNKATINQIERGRRSPNVETLERLAQALGAEMADFFPKAQAPLFSGEQVEEPRRPGMVPALPEIQDWVIELGPEAALLAMSDDEFYGHAESVIGGDPLKASILLDQLETGREAIETALKGSTQDMPEALRPDEPASDPEDRVHAAIRRRQPRRRVAQWARARAHVRALNLFEHALRRTAAMPDEARVDQLLEETAEKQA